MSAEEKPQSFAWGRYLYEPTDLLTFCIDEYWSPGQSEWADSKTEKLETKLGPILDAIVATGNSLRLRHIEMQEKERLRIESEKRAQELRQRWAQEQARRQTLEQQSDLWNKADRLRSFIACCEARLAIRNELEPDSRGSRWLEWARRHAEELDPLNGDYLTNAIGSLPETAVAIAPP